MAVEKTNSVSFIIPNIPGCLPCSSIIIEGTSDGTGWTEIYRTPANKLCFDSDSTLNYAGAIGTTTSAIITDLQNIALNNPESFYTLIPIDMVEKRLDNIIAYRAYIDCGNGSQSEKSTIVNFTINRSDYPVCFPQPSTICTIWRNEAGFQFITMNSSETSYNGKYVYTATNNFGLTRTFYFLLYYDGQKWIASQTDTQLSPPINSSLISSTSLTLSNNLNPPSDGWVETNNDTVGGGAKVWISGNNQIAYDDCSNCTDPLEFLFKSFFDSTENPTVQSFGNYLDAGLTLNNQIFCGMECNNYVFADIGAYLKYAEKVSKLEETKPCCNKTISGIETYFKYAEAVGLTPVAVP